MMKNNKKAFTLDEKVISRSGINFWSFIEHLIRVELEFVLSDMVKRDSNDILTFHSNNKLHFWTQVSIFVAGTQNCNFNDSFPKFSQLIIL